MNVVMSVCTTVEVGTAVHAAAQHEGLTISRAIERALRKVYMQSDDEKLQRKPSSAASDA